MSNDELREKWQAQTLTDPEKVQALVQLLGYGLDEAKIIVGGELNDLIEGDEITIS